jgi:hypothetical protein
MVYSWPKRVFLMFEGLWTDGDAISHMIEHTAHWHDRVCLLLCLSIESNPRTFVSMFHCRSHERETKLICTGFSRRLTTTDHTPGSGVTLRASLV